MKNRSIQYYWNRVSQHRTLIGSLLLFYVVITLISLIPAFLQRKIFDFAIPNQDIQALIYILLGVIIINIALFCFNLISELMLNRLSEDNRFQMKKQVIRKLLTLPYPFQSRSSLGETHKMIDDTEQLSTVPRLYLNEIIRNIIIIIIDYPILFFLSYKLTLIRLIGFPIEFFVGRHYRRKDRELEKTIWSKQRQITVLLNESHRGASTLKSLQGEGEVYRRLRVAHLELKEIQLKRLRMNASWKGINSLSSQMLGSLVFFLAAWDIIHGNFSFGSFIAFNIINAQGAAALNGLANAYRNSGSLQNSAERLESFNELPSEHSLSIAKDCTRRIRGHIVFDKVSFSYVRGSYALEDLSFQIEEASHVALVGPSGAGKSTVMNLLLGFSHPQRGKLLIGEQSIDEYEIRELRSSIAIVHQESFLFGGTIRENLVLGTSISDENRIWNALSEANAAEFVSRLPEKLDSPYGSQGTELSGGQRQRISIARLFLRNPSILILDEATGSQDMESERHIQEALERLREGRTTLTIAHRLNTVARADNILVLHRGQLVQTGAHQDLLAQEGLYQQLFNNQGLLYG